jgi:hypothetical protein
MITRVGVTRFGNTALVVAVATAALLAGCARGTAQSSLPTSESSRGPSAATVAAPHLNGTEVFSRTLRLSPSGPLAHPQTVRLPLSHRVPPGWAVVVATAETSQGPWSYLSAKLSPDRRTAIFTTTHHSVFTVIGEDLGSLLGFFKTEFLDGLSSGATASAVPPTCDNPAAARSGYTVRNSSGAAVYWCFGMNAARQRILRIVNNRLYPLEIQHPGLTVAEPPAIDYGALASLSHLLSGQESVLAPGAQIGYLVKVAPSQEAGAQTAMDGFGQSVFALQTGINSLLAILTRFGAGGASKSVAVMNAALGQAACADAAFAGNPGAILASCLSPKDMAEYFGTAGVLLAPLAATGGLAAFFASEFQALHDTLTSEDKYTVVIGNSSPAAPSCSASLLFAAAVAGQHFSTAPGQYPPGADQGPGAYDPVCDSGWAIALVSHPQVGTTDGEVLFRAEGSTWAYVAGVGGMPADCILQHYGVPAAVAKILWPNSMPASFCATITW